MMDTPGNSPRSPRGSPRSSPRGSPRGSPRSSPRSPRNHARGRSLFFLRRNMRAALAAIKREEKTAKKLQRTRSAHNASLGMSTHIAGVIYENDYLYSPFSRHVAQDAVNIVDREASLQFDEPTTSTIMVDDIIRVHARSNIGKPCSTTGGDIFQFKENGEGNMMHAADPSGRHVLLDASLLRIYRA